MLEMSSISILTHSINPRILHVLHSTFASLFSEECCSISLFASRQHFNIASYGKRDRLWLVNNKVYGYIEMPTSPKNTFEIKLSTLVNFLTKFKILKISRNNATVHVFRLIANASYCLLYVNVCVFRFYFLPFRRSF